MPNVPLSTGLGEIMAPQTLVMALVVTPEGGITVDPGALHGRSELEGRLTMVPKRALVGDGTPSWLVWVAVELDAANQPLRYKGLAAGELLVNLEKRLGYKSVAEQVNRMGEAMRGAVNVGRLNPHSRAMVKRKLVEIGQDIWERSGDALKQSLE